MKKVSPYNSSASLDELLKHAKLYEAGQNIQEKTKEIQQPVITVESSEQICEKLKIAQKQNELINKRIKQQLFCK